MTESDRVAKSDNFNFRVAGGGRVPSFLQVLEKRSQTTRKIDGMFAQFYNIHVSINYFGR